MSKLKSFLGYFIAILGVPALLVLFMGTPAWMELLVSSTGLKINPLYTGGEVARAYSQDGMRIEIYEPVFAALIGESKEGFVQVSFGPKAAARQIDAEIDYDHDGTADFRVQWQPDGAAATLTPYASRVLGLEGTYELNETYTIRVRLHNPNKP
ncbi:MAG: hypothetical protein ACOYYS_19155 [Chloroflexota bacterium]